MFHNSQRPLSSVGLSSTAFLVYKSGACCHDQSRLHPRETQTHTPTLSRGSNVLLFRSRGWGVLHSQMRERAVPHEHQLQVLVSRVEGARDLLSSKATGGCESGGNHLIFIIYLLTGADQICWSTGTGRREGAGCVGRGRCNWIDDWQGITI